MGMGRVNSIGSDFDLYMGDVHRHPLMTYEEEYQIAKLFKETGDLKYRQELVTANLRFVVKVASQYVKSGFQLSDLVQEGNMGLIRATEKFDPERKYKFISYAIWWIKAYIGTFILKNYRLIKVGTGRKNKKILSAIVNGEGQRILDMENLGDCDEEIAALMEEIAGESDISIDDLRRGFSMAMREISLETPMVDGEVKTLGDSIDDGVDSEEMHILHIDGGKMREVMKGLRSTLNEKELAILDKRILADDPKTLEEMGARFSVTRERIRQIEEKLRKKIRAVFVRSGLRDYV